MMVFITGSKIPISKLKEKWHIYPLEDIQEDKDGVKRKLIIMPKDAGRNEIVKRLETKIRDNTIPDDVWASPGLPMLILITSGLIIALFFGDIIWTLTSILLG